MRKLLILLFLSIPAWGQITDYNVPRSGVGLTVCIGPGSNTISGSPVKYAGSCLGPLALNATTFGYLDSLTGNLLTNTTGAPTSSCPIFEADTNSFFVTAVRDKRPSICGGGGGIPGTPATSVQINNSGVFGGVSLGNNQVLEGTAGNPIAANFAPPTPNSTAYYVTRNCGSMTSCTQIKADGKYVVDATSNSTTTITCPNNDCNFTAADVGKTVWATTQGTGAGIGYLIYTTYVCPVTTISTVNSAQSITVGTACTANGTANVALYWATDDGTALSGLDAAVGCANVYLPDTGVNGLFILTGQPFLVTAPSTSTCNQQFTTSSGAIAPSLIGTGFGASSTVLMISPSFNWTNCKAISGASKNVCIGGTARSIANLQVWGSGLTSASNSTGCSGAANKILISASPSSSVIYGVDVAGVCPGASGMIGVELNAIDETFDLGGVQEVGSTACNAHAAVSIIIRQSDCHNINVSGGFGLNVESAAQVLDLGSYPMASVQIGGKYQSRGTHFVAGNSGQTAVNVSLNGIWYSYSDNVATDSAFSAPTTAVTVASGGQATFLNTTVSGTSSIGNTGTVISAGGNKLVSLPAASTGVWLGPDVMLGTCRGTATSSSTLGLYQLGQFATANCTSTVVNLGRAVPIVPISGSVFGLAVSAGTGCKSGNTCTFTVLKNGSATTLTCSMTGGASACQDVSHFDIPIPGDTYSIQFTTGATETLANVTATLLDW